MLVTYWLNAEDAVHMHQHETHITIFKIDSKRSSHSTVAVAAAEQTRFVKMCILLHWVIAYSIIYSIESCDGLTATPASGGRQKSDLATVYRKFVTKLSQYTSRIVKYV